MPATMLIRVVLPAPLGPSSARISPAWTSRSTRSSAVKSPYRLVRLRRRTTGSGTGGSVAGKVRGWGGEPSACTNPVAGSSTGWRRTTASAPGIRPRSSTGWRSWPARRGASWTWARGPASSPFPWPSADSPLPRWSRRRRCSSCSGRGRPGGRWRASTPPPSTPVSPPRRPASRSSPTPSSGSSPGRPAGRRRDCSRREVRSRWSSRASAVHPSPTAWRSSSPRPTRALGLARAAGPPSSSTPPARADAPSRPSFTRRSSTRPASRRCSNRSRWSGPRSGRSGSPSFSRTRRPWPIAWAARPGPGRIRLTWGRRP